jgi:hypothetical protein
MQTDRYTRAVLTIIALALVAIAVQLGGVVPSAHADGVQVVRLDGPVEVRPVEIRRISDAVDVELKHAFSAAGSSRGTPLYVEVGQ